MTQDEELVGVLTAGDDDVCQLGEDIAEGGPYELSEARGLIPAHPNCRCVFIPAGEWTAVQQPPRRATIPLGRT